MAPAPTCPRLLEASCTDRRMRQRQASPHTLASARDPCYLLLRVAQPRLHTAPATLTLAELDAPFLSAFREHREQARGHGAVSRHARLAARPACFRSVACHAPHHRALLQRVLAIPRTRAEQTPLACVTRVAREALLAAPDPQTWAGRRDRT